MRIIIIALLSLISLISACSSSQEKSPAAAYEKETAQQMFTLAEKDLTRGNYGEAAKRFEALDALYPYSEYAERAQLDTVYAYYMGNEHASALAAADRFIRLYPRGAHTDYAYYMKGMVNFGRGQNWLQKKVGVDLSQRELVYVQNAFIDFGALLANFPQSRYAGDARKRMVYIRNLLASGEMSIAQFYFDRKAYVAAANRASYVFEHYQGSPEIPRALAMMVRSYRFLGHPKMAEESLLVLQHNYPHSKELKEVMRNQ
jgi:outer membrane protein assembly factor BamD